MAVSVVERKRPTCNPNLKEDFIKDVVDSLDLTIPQKDLPRILEKIQSETHKFPSDSVRVALSIFGVLSKEYEVSKYQVVEMHLKAVIDRPKEEDQESSGLSKKDLELVKQYHKNGSLATSDVSWAVLQEIGIVNLTIEAFVAAANSRKEDIIPLQFDLEHLKFTLSMLSNHTGNFSDRYLGLVGTVLFSFCVGWLDSKFKGKFIYRVEDDDDDIVDDDGQPGVSDRTILRIRESNSAVTIAIVEIKTDVPTHLDQITSDAEYSKSLAQLVYMGKETCKCQSFMPLLVLTNCAFWHIFDLDKDGQPKRYCFVGPGGPLPLSPHATFDVSVCSEVIAFVQRSGKEFSSVQSQQQPAVQ